MYGVHVLDLEPVSWFSNDYAVSKEGREIATIDLSWIREAGSFRLAGRTFHLGRESGWGDFFLKSGDEVLAAANKTSVWRHRFELMIAGEEYELEKTSWMRHDYSLTQAGRQVGEVRRPSLWSRRFVASLPDDMPDEEQIFVAWLVLLMQRRENTSAASG